MTLLTTPPTASEANAPAGQKRLRPLVDGSAQGRLVVMKVWATAMAGALEQEPFVTGNASESFCKKHHFKTSFETTGLRKMVLWGSHSRIAKDLTGHAFHAVKVSR